MEESLTLYHAIALLAYRDDTTARRYGAKPSVRESGQTKRRPNVLYPTISGLPGTEAFKGIRDEAQLSETTKQWDELDESRWAAAKEKLWVAVQTGRVPVFDASGEVNPTFWLTHDLDSPETQLFRFRRSDLVPLLHEGGGRLSDAWIRADRLFQALDERGVPDPNEHVMPALRAGQLTGWLGNHEDAATAWTRIETRLFVLGMVIHRSGRLTKGDIPMEQYVALQQVPVGSVWFMTEELRRLGLIPSPTTSWRSVTGGSRRAAWLTRFKERKRHERRWVRGADLADCFTHQRGAITTVERQALYDEACQQIFRSLLCGEFTDEHRQPHVRPHQLNEVGFQRLTPEHAERFRGLHWEGRRDRDGEPLLSGQLLREFMLDVWLPTRLVTVWCQERNMRLPQGLAALGPTRATAVDEVILQSPVNEREADLTPEDARATQARGPAHEGQDQRLWAPEDFARPSTRVQHLIEWACWKYKIQPKEDNQTVPGRDELLRDHQKTFGPIKGISEKTMRAVRDALTTEQQRRGGAPAHRGRK